MLSLHIISFFPHIIFIPLCCKSFNPKIFCPFYSSVIYLLFFYYYNKFIFYFSHCLILSFFYFVHFIYLFIHLFSPYHLFFFPGADSGFWPNAFNGAKYVITTFMFLSFLGGKKMKKIYYASMIYFIMIYYFHSINMLYITLLYTML